MLPQLRLERSAHDSLKTSPLYPIWQPKHRDPLYLWTREDMEIPKTLKKSSSTTRRHTEDGATIARIDIVTLPPTRCDATYQKYAAKIRNVPIVEHRLTYVKKSLMIRVF